MAPGKLHGSMKLNPKHRDDERYIGQNDIDDKRISKLAYFVILTVDISLVFHKKLCDLLVVVLGCTMKWCKTLHTTCGSKHGVVFQGASDGAIWQLPLLYASY